MGRYTQETGGTFKQAPADTHVARCYRLIDLGTQRGSYQGEPTIRNQVLIGWELPDCPMDDGKPFTVSAFVTNSLGEKAKLRKWLEAWRGRQFTAEELKRFDLQNILGAPCLVTVIHNEKGRAVVESVTKVPKSIPTPDAVNQTSAFWLDEFDAAKFDALPDGIKEIIKQSDEWKAMNQKPDTSRHFDDMADDIPADPDLNDIPF